MSEMHESGGNGIPSIPDAPAQDRWEEQPLGGFEPEETTTGPQPETTDADAGADGGLTDQEKALAREWGWSDEDIGRSDPDVVRKALSAIASKFIQPQQPQQQTAQTQPPPPDSGGGIRIDVSGIDGLADLSDEVQSVVSGLAARVSDTLERVVRAAAQDYEQLVAGLRAVTEHADHQYVRSLLSGLGGEWEEAARPFLAEDRNGWESRGRLIQTMRAMASAGANMTPESMARAVLYAMRGDAVREAAKKARVEQARKSNAVLAGHVGGGASTRKSAAARVGDEAAIAAVREILSR